MQFDRVWIFRGEKGFAKGTLRTQDGRIALLSAGEPEGGGGFHEEAGDEDRFLLPGLIDIHTHGNSGCDFSDGSLEGLERMGRYLAARGVTSFLPTSMTLPYEQLEKAFETARLYAQNLPEGGARVAGIHMEGPFFSEKKKGAQNADYLRLPDFEAFERLQHGCGDLIRIVDAAPELPGAAAFAASARALCTVSAAHTDASYEDTAAFYESGASHLTHLFNAMPPIHHRHPGVIGAASERENVTAELICDGLHVHPSAVRMAFRLFPGRICLISDALRCCGMPDGMYELGGQTVRLSGGIARLEDGTIAGAASNLFEDLKNAVRFGIPLPEAILAATRNPAGVIGRAYELGSLEEGMLADFVVCDRHLNLLRVFIGGNEIACHREGNGV